jgi:hypothetical protein
MRVEGCGVRGEEGFGGVMGESKSLRNRDDLRMADFITVQVNSIHL